MAGFDSYRWSLKGMTALIINGTKGIGYAIVEELVGLGATVHTCARSKTQILERLQQWENKGFKVTGSVCDLTSKAQRENLIKTVSSIFDGKLSILVNSAATCKLRGTTYYTLEDFSTMMETNVESPYHLSQLAHPLLKAFRNVSIVFVASIVGVVALPKLSTMQQQKPSYVDFQFLQK
nr:tropinone reductase homolog At2g29150-like [Malus domestica]